MKNLPLTNKHKWEKMFWGLIIIGRVKERFDLYFYTDDPKSKTPIQVIHNRGIRNTFMHPIPEGIEIVYTGDTFGLNKLVKQYGDYTNNKLG